MIRLRCINNNGTAECAEAHQIHDSSHQSINVPALIGLIGDWFPSLQLSPLPTWCETVRRTPGPRERRCSASLTGQAGTHSQTHARMLRDTHQTHSSGTDLSVFGRTRNVSDHLPDVWINSRSLLMSSVRPRDERDSTHNSTGPDLQTRTGSFGTRPLRVKPVAASLDGT